MSKVKSIAEAVQLINDDDVVAVNSSSGLCCPDEVLKALGDRFSSTGKPTNLTTVHNLAAGDLFGMPGIDHIAQKRLLGKIIGGSYPSGPSSATRPKIWDMILNEDIPAWNLPSGVVFDMLREGSSLRPGVLTKIGLNTFVDPELEGGAMNKLASNTPLVKRVDFEGETWLHYPGIKPNVSIIRASTSDENGNLTFEREGATLGAMEMALAARNSGGIVIAQVARVAAAGTLNPHDVIIPGILVDVVVECPNQLQTTDTQYDPTISGEVVKPLNSFDYASFGIQKIIARRVAQELKIGWTVNIGFGASANVPRILLEEGYQQGITWVIEQGAVGGVPLLDFKFGCAANAEAFVSSPQQFAYFQSGMFDCSLLSFLEVDKQGAVNVSRLPTTPHRTAGSGGFIDITTRAKKIVFSGSFNAGAKMKIEGGKLSILQEGKFAKFVDKVNQVTYAGLKNEQEQRVTYITERCVIELTPRGLMVTEVAPGIDLERDILAQADTPLMVADNLKLMDAKIFQPEKFGLEI